MLTIYIPKAQSTTKRKKSNINVETSLPVSVRKNEMASGSQVSRNKNQYEKLFFTHLLCRFFFREEFIWPLWLQ